MKHYLSLHLEAACQAFARLVRQPLGTLMVLLMLAAAMTLPLMLYLGVQSSKDVLDKLNDVPNITLYMDAAASPVNNETVQKLLAEDKRVQAVKFVGKEQGLAEMQQAMGGQEIGAMLDENPLPDAFIVTPKENNPQAIAALQEDLSHYPMVESAQMDKEWMQTLYQFNQLVNKVFWFLAVTLGLAFVLVANNTIRLQILTHKEEIEITKLLGAPSSFVRRPFLYQAAWESLLASGMSLGLCTLVMQTSQPLVNQIFQPYGINLQWRTFTPSEMTVVLLVVCLLGMMGAWLAVTQHLFHFRAKRD